MADEKDDILAETRAAFEGLTNDAPEAEPLAPAAESAPVEAAETAEQKADRARDEAGRFAKQPKERPTLTLKEPKEPTEKPLAADTTQPSAAPVSSPVQGAPAAPEKIAPPQEWGGLAKVKWDRLPIDVQKEIAAHEQKRAAATADLAPVSELLGVNREFLVNQAGSVPEAFRQMMQFARMSVDNPVQLAEHILRARGIDPRAAFSGQPQAAAAQPQDIQSLLAQLVDQRLQPILAQSEQQQTQQLQTTIDQFASDPKRPFFNDVRVHMGQLIQAGTAKSMDEAYEQATWANPAIRAHLMQEATEATKQAQAAQVQKAQQARRASVTGSPLTGAALNGRGNPNSSALDDVRSAFEELSGA